MTEESKYISEDLIIRYLNGGVTDKDQLDQIEKWLSVEENLQEARKIYQTWELSMLAAPTKKNVDHAFTQLKERLDSTQPRKPKSISLWWYAAASIALIGVFIFLLIPNGKPEIKTLVADQQVGEFKLADGTTITLNERSKIIYTPEEFNNEKVREMMLEGVAYFDVAHQPDRPFVVKTRDAEVKVLGTQFMVKTFPQKPTEVLVTEGKVQVTYSISNKAVILTANEEIKLDKVEDKVDLVVTPSDDNHLYWKTGVMTFQEDSLGKVFETLSTEFETAIIAENEAILSCSITATFKKQSLETIIEVIKSTHQLSSYQNGDSIVITGYGCR